MDAKSAGFTSRICDTANSLLLGEFPWGSDKRSDSITIKQQRLPKPIPVRLRIGPPNSSSLVMSDADTSEYENEEYNSFKSVIQALREMSRKRTHSFMNEESDSELDSAAAPKKPCNPMEHRHNLYLSQLEEETQEYKNGLNGQSEHLERGKRSREEDMNNTTALLMGGSTQETTQNKRQRRLGVNDDVRPPDERSTVISCSGNTPVSTASSTITSGILQQTIVPRRGSNEIISSLSSSLTLLDPAVLYKLIKPSRTKRRRKPKKVVAVETQTMQPITEEETPKGKELSTTPKTEDKAINTDPEKPAKVEEKIVTDKMANALIKSAVSKFLATEDPALSPVRSPPKPLDNSSLEKPASTPGILKNSAPSAAAPPSSILASPNAAILPLSVPSNDKPLSNNTFTFGALNTSSDITVPSSTPIKTVSPFTFGSPSVSCDNSTTTANSFLSTTKTTQAVPDIITTPKTTHSLKQVSFGDSKLVGFTLPETKSNTESEKTDKSKTPVSSELFKQPASTPSINSSVAANRSDLSKGTFSFAPSAPASTTSASISNNSPKAPTFTFGTANANANVPKFGTTPAFASSNETSKKTEPPKLSFFGTPSTPTTTKSIESTQMTAETVSSTTSGFQFGANTDSKKVDKPEEPKPPGLFSFGAGSSIPTTKTETKPFTFGASTSNKTETTQSAQQTPKPVFQFGPSSFSAPQPNKEGGFSFGSKPASEQVATAAPTFGSTSSGLFGTKPSTPSTSVTATTTAATTTGLFGFGSVQPASTTVTPTFGNVTSTTNTSLGGGINFQQKKPEEKAASGGFPFKFTGGTSTQSAEPAKPSFSFGASSAQSSTPAFGANTMPVQPTFGSVTPAAPSFTGFSTPSFGQTPTAPTSAPTFGAAATPAPTFGTPAATQPAPPVFGTMQTQQNQGPSFTFGASTVSNPSSGFNFGTPAQPSAQPASSGMFQFGSSAAQQNPAGGIQPFQFSAGSNANNTPGFGFSSPLGGFNPGVASGGQPMFSIGSGSTAPRSRQLRRKK